MASRYRCFAVMWIWLAVASLAAGIHFVWMGGLLVAALVWPDDK